MMTVKELIEELDEYGDDTPIGISLWNPISKSYEGAEIRGLNKVTTPGFINYVMLETPEDTLQLAYEKTLKPKNKN